MLNIFSFQQAFVARLFDSEDKQVLQRVDKLIEKESKLRGTPVDGFTYAGHPYRRSGLRGRVHFKSCSHELYEEVEKHRKYVTKLNEDKQFVGQIIATLLRDCENPQDVRDALPDVLVNLVKEIAQFPRTRPEAYTLEGNERAKKQYATMLETIQFYFGMKFFN